MNKNILPAAIVTLSTALGSQAVAVEGGLPAYLLGSRDSLAGIIPGPGTYTTVDFVHFSGDVTGLSVAGLPIRADTNSEVSLIKLNATQVFDGEILGGTPAINIDIPFIIDASLDFTAVSAPLAGANLSDSDHGLGDISFTPMLGWHNGFMHYSAGMTIYAPTGDYDAAAVSTAPPSVDIVNPGRNVWSYQPVVSATYLNTDTGLELSGAASFLFSQKNDTTNYQSAPAFTFETAAMQHLPNGWALGAMGYWYTQLDDDSGAGAEATRNALGAGSLRARTFGAGPLITYSGEMFGQPTSFKFKYITEFGSKRSFEKDVLWANITMSF